MGAAVDQVHARHRQEVRRGAAQVPVERRARSARPPPSRWRATPRGSRWRPGGSCPRCRRARSASRRCRPGRGRRARPGRRRSRSLTCSTAFSTPLPRKRALSPSRSSSASRLPVDAPEGTIAVPTAPPDEHDLGLDGRVAARVEHLATDDLLNLEHASLLPRPRAPPAASRAPARGAAGSTSPPRRSAASARSSRPGPAPSSRPRARAGSPSRRSARVTFWPANSLNDFLPTFSMAARVRSGQRQLHPARHQRPVPREQPAHQLVERLSLDGHQLGHQERGVDPVALRQVRRHAEPGRLLGRDRDPAGQEERAEVVETHRGLDHLAAGGARRPGPPDGSSPPSGRSRPPCRGGRRRYSTRSAMTRFGEIDRHVASTTPKRSASPSVARPISAPLDAHLLAQPSEVLRRALRRVPAEVRVLGGVHHVGGAPRGRAAPGRETRAPSRTSGSTATTRPLRGDRLPVDVAVEAREVALGERRGLRELPAAARRSRRSRPPGGDHLGLDRVGELLRRGAFRAR